MDTQTCLKVQQQELEGWLARTGLMTLLYMLKIKAARPFRLQSEIDQMDALSKAFE